MQDELPRLQIFVPQKPEALRVPVRAQLLRGLPAGGGAGRVPGLRLEGQASGEPAGAGEHQQEEPREHR